MTTSSRLERRGRHGCAVVLLLAARIGGPLALPAGAFGASPAAPASGEAASITAAQAALDAGRPEETIRLLRAAEGAPALLLRSTARFLLGEERDGRKDLEAALRLDPTLRQGWLNRAALSIADRRYDDAWADLVKARDLDPTAADNDINLGAVELLRRRLEPARSHFAEHLRRFPNAEARYAIASNYAHAGYAALAAEELAAAIALDERSRVRAKGDPNFAALAEQPALQSLWSVDAWRPAAGTPTAEEAFAADYEAGRGPLLPAVLDGLTDVGETPEPRVEVFEEWALLWTPRLRVRVRPLPGQPGGQVTVWGTGAHFAPAAFESAARRLFRQINVRLLESRPGGTPPPGSF